MTTAKWWKNFLGRAKIVGNVGAQFTKIVFKIVLCWCFYAGNIQKFEILILLWME